jgi:hypothetical protein
MAFTPVQVGGIDTDRYGAKFNADWLWVPVIANQTTFTPTEAEINAGRLLTGAIAAINGFNVSPRYDELPDLVSDVDPKVPAGSTVDDSALSFYLASDDDDALDFFNRGDLGYVIQCPRGLEGGYRAWVWKVEVSVVLPTAAMTGGSMGVVGFGTLGAPKKIDLPAET